MKTIVLTAGIILASLFSTQGVAGDELKAKIEALEANDFQCIKSMTKVRSFFVDNVDPKKLDATMAVATAGKGEYPAGSVIQLVPTEVMIKHPKGTNAKTNDWEFIELTVNNQGSQIKARGFEDVVNRFGGNCLDCHKKAKPEFDMVCETGHGCDPIPITAPMIAEIQKTDPRCEVNYTLTEEEMKIAAQLKAAFGG